MYVYNLHQSATSPTGKSDVGLTPKHRIRPVHLLLVAARSFGLDDSNHASSSILNNRQLGVLHFSAEVCTPAIEHQHLALCFIDSQDENMEGAHSKLQ